MTSTWDRWSEPSTAFLNPVRLAVQARRTLNAAGIQAAKHTQLSRRRRTRQRIADSPTRSLARRFAGSLPPPLKLRRDLAEALRAKAGRRVARSLRSLATCCPTPKFMR